MVFHVKISVKRLPPLLKGLEGSDLKVRLESIESVTKILEEANKPILPAGTGDLFGALKGRPHDSNNIFFIIATLSTIGALTTTMDCQLRSQARDLFKWLSRRQLAGLVSSLDEIKLLKPTASAITVFHYARIN
ncbi:protein MOR1-like isoform X2 [Salvia splendens]|uniref:protein MOR1-like isoform X2 n=1 Tax=Salvia splendens TaxID=180675 RepID=UPI001C26B3B9|nr:protein MOR1-like isoform X2 [Salvia splendens]XP_042043310.1 protein MOR1-like isoform X2 [Salvia splendens]